MYNTEYAAHVLGRLSPIYYEDWVGDPENGVTGYRDMEGYSMNSLVGREGAEKAFESYLHGTKGTRIITTNEEQLNMFREMLMKTPVVAANDYMFGG